MSARRLLVVDDEREVGEFIRDVAEGLRFEVAAVRSGRELRQAIENDPAPVVVLDLKLPDEDGIELLNFLDARGYEGRMILVSGVDTKVLDSAYRFARSRGLDVRATLQKPILLADLETALQATVDPGCSITEEDLRHAVSDGQLVLHYQPKVNLTGPRRGAVEAVEALVRWQHPTHGLLSPDYFIEPAHDGGFLEPVTEFVLEEALRQSRTWREQGATLAVAVNLPPASVCDRDFPDRIGRLLETYEVPRGQLIVEVTETGVMTDAEHATEALTRLRLKDVPLSIDDFGTGYSSLVQLYRMPFSEIKIDKSFVREMNAKPEARVIVHSIIDLAHNLGMSACAEGLESEEVAGLLHAWGCDRAQGHLFSPAVPPHRITDLAWRGCRLPEGQAAHLAAFDASGSLSENGEGMIDPGRPGRSAGPRGWPAREPGE